MGFQTKGGKPSERLPTHAIGLDVPMAVKLYNVPLEWIVEIEEHFPGFDRGMNWRGTPMTPIEHCTLAKCYIGTLDVRLLPYKPSFTRRSRWNYKLNKTVFYKTRDHSASQRLEVKCPHCAKWVPFSRLNQHMYTRDGKRTWSCSTKQYKPLAEKAKARKGKEKTTH